MDLYTDLNREGADKTGADPFRRHGKHTTSPLNRLDSLHLVHAVPSLRSLSYSWEI